MADRENVTNLIRELQRYEPQCTDYFKDVIDAVIELLKEKEAQETRLVRRYSRPGVYADLWLHCEKCSGRIDNNYKPKYCPNCGRKVKWDEG